MTGLAPGYHGKPEGPDRLAAGLAQTQLYIEGCAKAVRAVARLAIGLGEFGHAWRNCLEAPADDWHVGSIGHRKAGLIPILFVRERRQFKSEFWLARARALTVNTIKRAGDPHDGPYCYESGVKSVPVDCHGRGSMRFVAIGREAAGAASRPQLRVARFAGEAA